jgi:N utilization substance protein B
MISRRRSRILAVQALYAWDMSGQVATPDLLRFSWYEKSHAAEDGELSNDEHFFARHLVLGVIEHRDVIDDSIKEQAPHWDFNRINKVDLAILRMGAYSLQYNHDIPSSITIDEAVGIAREYSSGESYRFINGVLDSIRKKLGV